MLLGYSKTTSAKPKKLQTSRIRRRYFNTSRMVRTHRHKANDDRLSLGGRLAHQRSINQKNKLHMEMIHPIPATMKMPGDKREGVWRTGVLQIWITRACDLSCVGCTQGSNLAGKPGMMTTEQFFHACESLMKPTPYFGVVGMFGGNPCVHPQFEELCWILRKWVPFEQRGLWSNNLNGHGVTCRKTFNPDVSNLNVHQSVEAAQEMLRDWPLCQPKGLFEDSRHSPPFVAMQDMEDMTDEERWQLIGDCDVNQRWSALIGVFRGELRGWFCELAGSQSMLHENEHDYPDTGIEIEPGWWRRPREDFDRQIRYHCFACGIPLRGHGDLANNGTTEHVSKTHERIYRLKRPAGRTVNLITRRADLGPVVSAATQYLPGEQA